MVVVVVVVVVDVEVLVGVVWLGLEIVLLTEIWRTLLYEARRL